MNASEVERATRLVVDAAKRWKEARGKWYKSATDKNADDLNYAEQRLSEAISAYDKAKRIATATAQSGDSQ